ncbi:hypothetical protein LTR62_002797 [Meristemomyces frigidus]|uniref:Fumarate lyase N-terminal domain-containing protein n=1 Tax=Meristemomyces frigidus TaxID=1508187 RepID=A0AAN7TIJ4_9PEZI|nr:hypothetical protein LTR62_002797 [Meristemomyces frigidus]
MSSRLQSLPAISPSVRCSSRANLRPLGPTLRNATTAQPNRYCTPQSKSRTPGIHIGGHQKWRLSAQPGLHTSNWSSRSTTYLTSRQQYTTTTVIDSEIYGTAFATSAVKAIWSDRTRTHYFLLFEAALATVQAKLGIIPSRAAEAITQQCLRVEDYDFDLLRKQTELIGYPVLPVVQQLVAKVNAVEAGLGEWAHWGATTQDVTDTAVILQLRDTMKLVEQSLDGITDALRSLAEKYKATPMAARSNLQQAVPISFGFKMARLLACFERHRLRLGELKPRLLVLQFGGAAGTLPTITSASSHKAPTEVDGVPLGLRCQALLAEELGLAVPAIAWHTERDIGRGGELPCCSDRDVC